MLHLVDQLVNAPATIPDGEPRALLRLVPNRIRRRFQRFVNQIKATQVAVLLRRVEVDSAFAVFVEVGFLLFGVEVSAGNVHQPISGHQPKRCFIDAFQLLRVIPRD